MGTPGAPRKGAHMVTPRGAKEGVYILIPPGAPRKGCTS